MSKEATQKQLEAADSAQSMGWEILETGEVDPRDLEIDDNMNGRRYSDQDVGEMVLSLLQDGQKSPICVRRNAKKKLSVVFGYRRSKAGIEIHEAGLRKGFKLRYELVDVDDKTSFLANVIENNERQGLTDIDHAHNIDKLRRPVEDGGFGMEQQDIARRMNKSASWVSLTVKLLKLTAAQQKLVAQFQTTNGKKGISPASAYDLAEIEDPKERQKEIETILKTNDGKVPRSAVRKRKAAKTSGGETSARTAKEIRFPFDQVVDDAQARIAEEGGEMNSFELICKDFSKFCKGKLGDRAMLTHLREALPKK